MQSEKIVLLHFNPIEMYPPATNMLRYLTNLNKYNVSAYTITKYNNKATFRFEKGIKRFGPFKESKTGVYLSYLVYNLRSIIALIINRPKVIICYETLSIFPAYIYKFINPKFILLIHYHEFTSSNEKNVSSKYLKFLYLIEKKIFNHAIWISHTNEHRLNFFMNEHKYIAKEKLKILQNFPPQKWQDFFLSHSKNENRLQTKFVYVGALSFNSTFVKEFIDWVEKKQGQVTLDIYSSNNESRVLNYLKKCNSEYIHYCGGIEYNKLPEVLPNYDIGVIFYKGIIPNHVFSAPNKLFEYLVCGLDVWISKQLIGSKNYVTNLNKNKIKFVDFEKFKTLDQHIKSKIKKDQNSPLNYCYEEEYEKIRICIENALKNKLC